MDILYIIQYYLLEVYNSTFFVFIRFLLGIYILVVCIDILLLLFFRKIGEDIIQGIYGADMPSSHRRKVLKRWQGVEAQIKSGQEAQYKLAILEADAIVDEVLRLANIPGENMAERLNNSFSYQVEHRDRLMWAHGIRNSIIREATFSVDYELVEKVISTYKEFLESWETL